MGTDGSVGRGVVRYGLVVAAPTLVALVVVLAVSERAGVETYILTDDPLSVLDAPGYVGILSRIGNLLWAATAAVLAFAAGTARSDAGGLRSLVAGMAVLTVLLLADDGFGLHEEMPLEGLPLQAGIAAFGAWWLLRHREVVRTRTALPLLFAALAFAVVSTVIDAGLDLTREAPSVADAIRSVTDPVPLQATFFRIVGKGEEVMKLLAIQAWAVYAWTISRDLVHQPRP